MGKNNKARRAAKARTKAKRRARRPPHGHRYPWGGSGSTRFGGDRRHGGDPWSDEPLFDDAEGAQGLLWLTADAQRRGEPFAELGRARLAEVPASVLWLAAEHALVDQVAAIWDAGWQPRELLRQGRRATASAAAARLVALAIAADHGLRPASTLDDRWAAQVEGLDLPPVDGPHGWARAWARDEGLDTAGAVAAVIDGLAALAVRPLDPILPPPGSTRPAGNPGPHRGMTHRSGRATTDPVLERIRALLAKAESTTFEAEALAFTVKAQELMTRHAIDAALLDEASGADHDDPVTIRLPVDAPYADVKSLLLQVVAEAGRCRTVFHQGVDLSSVVGFADDVAAVELLFTSLLVQAQTALSAAARNAPPGTRVRSQGYRSAFLLSFTERIGERLDAINAEVYASVEAEHGRDFLPALRSRQDEVDDAVTERFGELSDGRVRGGYDTAGWAGGRLAADRAQLGFGDIAEAS